MQINPNEVIELAVLISDTTDTSTYYTRAVVRDTARNVVLDTVNLTRSATNSRRFYGSTRAPSVNSSNGYWIDITTTIYTDSGYTTPAAAYGEEITRYMVAPRWTVAQGGGGSGDPFEASYRTDSTRSALREEFAVLLEEIGKIGKPTKVVKGKVSAPAFDVENLQARLAETVAMTLSKKGKEARKSQEVLDGAASEISKAIDELRQFTGIPKKLEEILKKLEYVWEHEYLTKMTGDGSPLPPASSEMPRTATDGVLPLSKVMEAHAARRAGFFDHVPTPTPGGPGFLPPGKGGRQPSAGVVPAHLRAPAGNLPPVGAPAAVAPLPGGAEIPATKRRPSSGVFPKHVIEGNKQALAQLPQRV